MKQTHSGGCHCGAVRYEVDLDLSQGTIRCNSSIRSQTRARLASPGGAGGNASLVNARRRKVHSWLDPWPKILWLFAALVSIAPATYALPLRVMTFNIRLLTNTDGPNNWDARRDIVVAMLREEDPDVIGTQELYKRQGDELVAAIPQYTWFGEGRGGGDDDEHMGVFYRKDRLRVLESGNFWLSNTPDVPGSRTWGNLYPRMVTWARFQRIADRATFTLYNTHLPYRKEDEAARLRCAELIRARLEKLPENEGVILIGDFNTSPDSRVHAVLSASLTDAWTTSPRRSGPEATFHGFTGQADRRIDWLLFRGLEASWVKTVTTHREERYPSDHFPVIAEYELATPRN